MNRTIAREAGTIALLSILSALAVVSPGAAAERVRHASPPAIGELLVPQSGLFRCASAAGARYAAETGFLAADCTRVERADTWRVVGCTLEALSHGALRLVEVVAPDGRRAWVPLPWHDWA